MAQTKSGPDIATQWATLPVLTPAWNGASVPISDYVPASETKNWIGTAENMSGGKLWAMPQYLLGIPFVWNKAMFKKAGLNPNKGPKTWAEFLADAKKLKAAGSRRSAWAIRTVTGAPGSSRDRQAEPKLDRRAQGRDDRTRPSSPTAVLGFLPGAGGPQKNGYLDSDVASISFTEGCSASARSRRDVLGH